MRWSKLKSTVESRFASCIKGKVQIYCTTWGGCGCGRGWITYYKEQIANFETIPHFNLIVREGHPTNECGHVIVENDEDRKGKLVMQGEMSRFAFSDACRELLNSPIEESLSSSNPIVKGLAFLDARLGKRKLLTLETTDLHSLSKKLLEIRLKEEEQFSSKRNKKAKASP